MPRFGSSTSTGTCCSSTCLKATYTEAVSVTSHGTTASPSTGSPDRDVTVTWSPPAARRRAIASPIPRFPPVTRTDRLMSQAPPRLASWRAYRARLQGRAWDRLPVVDQSTHTSVTSAGNGANRIDPEFAALPLRELAGVALQQARDLGAQHADFRAELIRGQH